IAPEAIADAFSNSPEQHPPFGGLGIAVARHLVSALGGHSSVHSVGLDHGATFKVTFPLTNAVAAKASAETFVSLPIAARPLDRPGYTESYAELQGVRVLVVDDDDATRDAVQTVFRLSGVSVRAASTVSEALHEFDRFKPEALVCDIALAGEDGLSFIRSIRARGPEDGALIPAMALTALTSKADRDRAIAAGFQLHVAKPVDIDSLRNALLRLLRREHASRQS
ncbi:MAG TPA: hybrid sensor histidine kinase/response regulator, partial [Polyangiales bacterium]|nr:hybrid sensor histidine kinase/response regulator [Polyangiales bacterium]